MDEKIKCVAPNVLRTSMQNVKIESADIFRLSLKDKHKTASASKLRSRVSQHIPSSPIKQEKSLTSLQKQLDKLCSFQVPGQMDKKNAEAPAKLKCKSRPASSNKPRKSSTFKPSNKDANDNVIELKHLRRCKVCDTCWASDSIISPLCILCNKNISGLAIQIEVKFHAENSDKATLVIGGREIYFSTKEKLQCTLAVPNLNIEKRETAQFREMKIEMNDEWKIDSVYVSTPNFHGKTEELLVENSVNDPILETYSPREVSFAEDFRNNNLSLQEHIDELVKYRTEIVQSVTIEKITDIIEEFSQRYSETCEKIKASVSAATRNYASQSLEIFLKIFEFLVMFLMKEIKQEESINDLQRRSEDRTKGYIDFSKTLHITHSKKFEY